MRKSWKSECKLFVGGIKSSTKEAELKVKYFKAQSVKNILTTFLDIFTRKLSQSVALLLTAGWRKIPEGEDEFFTYVFLILDLCKLCK